MSLWSYSDFDVAKENSDFRHLAGLPAKTESRQLHEGAKPYTDAKRLIPRFVADPTEQQRAELSDYGVNFLREYAKDQGWTSKQLAQLMHEELARMRGLTRDLKGLLTYAKVSRAGSMFRLTRHARGALFMQAVALRYKGKTRG